ncbi:hypothetical protein OIDMADRAFT_177292 [Oidiodendron maius Zn]|uniref:Uncharacterized protein n=1 Tax=Oidiodendron maius (strain Zn) TaxID=913774 RepID=A0A0C3HPJ6_OIDMZ|nr:hypothetical protein OIDMADRAFT_177292 [Oidiodendron maius Zn]
MANVPNTPPPTVPAVPANIGPPHMEKETAYRIKSDLSQHQITECEALFGIAVKTVKGAKATKTQINDFWHCVFDRWTSAKKPTMPRYKNRQAADSSVEVGIFKCDLPAGKGGEVQIQRLKGAPAFLKVHVGGSAKSLSWLWVDSVGQTVNQSYIDLFDGQPLQSFFKDAVIQYDRAELPRLCQWNSRLAVYITRRRIFYWTKNGYPSVVTGEDELTANFEEVILCQDLLPFYVQLAQQIENDGGNTGVMATFIVSV